MMRLSKLAQNFTFKTNVGKYAEKSQQQQTQYDFNDKLYSGSQCSSINNCVQLRHSLGNGSCVSSNTTTGSVGTKTGSTSTSKRSGKSKKSKCFDSTVFRCCLPCRGGGSPSAGPAPSPFPSPLLPTSNDATNNLAILDGQEAKQPYGNEEEEFIAVKKHSLAETVATSATTPLSLKSLIKYDDNDEDLIEPPLRAVHIAQAKLASGVLARKAEPETLSDKSVSPTTINLTTTTTTTSPAGSGPTSDIFELHVFKDESPASLNKAENIINTLLALQTPVSEATLASTNDTIVATASTQTAVANTTPARCCCQSQTSPLPHIQEEEESDLQIRLQQQPHDLLQPIASYTSGSDSSVHKLSAAVGVAIQESPSPRIKHKFRKQHKSVWSRIILASGANVAGTSIIAKSNETLTSSESNKTNTNNNSSTNNSSSASVAQRLSSTSASAITPYGSSQYLTAAKMQAEQGSIGDLQKYHSRYLKNRRHTLANVR